MIAVAGRLLYDPRPMMRGFLPFRRHCLPSLLVLLLAGVRLAFAVDPPTGEGEPFTQYFSPRDYQGGTQCLCAAQDARGIMYIGSLGLVLEYDGSSWRKIEIDTNFASAIACDPGTNTVFFGAQNDLGYLELLPGGSRKAVSLLDQLPADARDVGTVNGVHVTPAGVFFVGTRRVMRWRDGRFRTWELRNADKLDSSWADGVLYVYSPEVGLLRMDGDALVTASDDPLFHRALVRSILTEPDGTLLIGTRDGGLYSLRDRIVRPLDCECGDFLKRAGLYKILRLRDGSLAIATTTAGLLVLDPSRRFRSRLDEKGGLHGKAIYDLFEDAEGGLWIGLQSGIVRAEIDSPLSVLRAGPDDDMSSAYCIGRWFDTTVLGNHTGLFRVVAADPVAAVGAHLEWLPGTTPSADAVCTVANGLLTLTGGKIFLLDADARLVPVATEISDAQDLFSSCVHPGRVYVAEEKGCVRRLRFDEVTRTWVDDGLAVDLGAEGGQLGVTESARGDLWVTTFEHGLFRVEFAPDGQAEVTSFFDRPGPLQGSRDVLICDGSGPPCFKALHQFCGLDSSGQGLRTLTEFGERFYDGSYNLGGGTSHDAESLWLTATSVNDPTGESLRGRATAGRAGRPPTFRALPHEAEEMIGKVGVFLPVDLPPDPLTTLLLVGTTGNAVVCMNVRQWDALPPPRPFATLIRRAVAADGGSPAVPPPILADPLPYKHDSVHFEFAAGTLALGAAPRFQTRLVNFGAGDWSDFTGRNSVDYLNLPEGSYTFEVRARNADGELGSVASLPFRILPPWQRTPWAYAADALALALALAALIHWRGRRLRLRNATLATLVDARTSELRGRESELLANERALVRARDDAEQANRAKSAFLANMSHELRTPLNAVLGYTQLLLKQTDLSARNREQIAVIGQSGSHLLSLVNEVLDLSKVEAGKLTVSRVDFSLPQLLDEVVAAFRPRFAEKGLAFSETRAPGLPRTVHTDPSRLRQVLFNLLSNAAKFTRHGGVSLEVRPVDGVRVRFEVADTGVGIEQRELRDIFLAFHQVGESSLASQGTGLGLTISQRLIEILGSRIEVESAPDRGSRFWFELPLPPVTPVGGPRDPALPDPTQGQVSGYEGLPRRLLLVDDVTENRRVLRDFLQPLGFEIEEAADGAECLAACARQLPHALLLDLRLGSPDGLEVARTLRARTPSAPLGIIAISASVFETDRQQAIDAGCDDFLPKPFEETQLLGTLGRVLGLRWVQAAPAPAAPVSGSEDGAEALPPEETELLLALSLRGDVAGIRKKLESLRSAGAPAGTAAFVRRLETLAASYDMEGIHALLLTVQRHAGN